MPGALAGIRVIELGGIGPGPFAGMLLVDQGAEVIRVERPGADVGAGLLMRSRKVVRLDLKNPDDVATVRELARGADVVIEGFRPGTVERLGIGPDVLLADNPRLVYGRMTGWGQNGPLARTAGHDINYIAMSGALHGIGPKARPYPPIAIGGDCGGGGAMLALGICAAIVNVRNGGTGQVVDCSMTEGSALLMTGAYEMVSTGFWKDEREANIIDGGAHFYAAYETADGKFVSIGAIEPQFYAVLLDKLALSDDAEFADQLDRDRWPRLRARLDAIFRTRTRDEWCEVFEGSDACFAPVLSLREAPQSALARARDAFVTVGGVVQPAPAPRFSVSQADAPTVPQDVDVADLLRRA